MKLLLLESVEGLGRPGDQVNVKPGFARNYLVPNRLATRVTEDTLRMLDKLKAKAEEEERAAIASARELAEKIEGFAVTVEARATDEGHLFGSVTEKDIHRALTEAGWELSVRSVRLSAHLKEAGVETVELHVYGDITATIQVEVVPIDTDGNVVDPDAAAESDDEGDGEAEGEGKPAAAESSDEGGEAPQTAAAPAAPTAPASAGEG